MRSLHRMQLRILFSLLLSLLPFANANIWAQEYAIVTGERGYVVGRNGREGYTVSYLGLIEFNGAEGDKLILSYLGGNYYIHKGQVHVIEELSLMNLNKPLFDSAQELLKDTLRMLRDASETASRGEARKAVEAADDAMISLTLVYFYDDTPFKPWYRHFLAYFEYLDNNLAAANEQLDTAEKLLAKLDDKEPVEAADVYNMRGIVRLKEGKNEEALALFQKALAIATAKLGKRHVDCAAIHANISRAHEALGQTNKAVLAQTYALNTLRGVLPTTAVELPNKYTELGFLVLADGKHDLAIQAFKLALADYQLLHSKAHPTEMANARLGLSDTYLEVEDYQTAEATLDKGMKFEVPKMNDADAASYRKEFLNRLGLLDYLQEDYTQALVHFQEAAQLHEPATEELVDGTTFENIANTHLYLDDSAKAKQAYRRALEIYTRTEGKESDNAHNITKLIAELE